MLGILGDEHVGDRGFGGQAAFDQRRGRFLLHDAGPAEVEARLRLRNIDMQMLRILEEISAGRQDATAEIRMDLARLTRAITGETGGR